MTDILDNWQSEAKALEADSVFVFIDRSYEIHWKPPSIRQCSDGTKLNQYRVKRAVARLRQQNRVSQTSLRPMQRAVQGRWRKRERADAH